MDALKRRDGDAFQIRSKAIKSKALAPGPSESKEEESLTGFSLALFGLCDVVETLVRTRVRERRGSLSEGNALSPAPPAAAMRASKESLGGSAAFAASGTDDGDDEEDWREHVQYLHCMVTSGAREVRLKAATTLGVLAQHSSSAKRQITDVRGIVLELVSMMKAGGLEAITAIAHLTRKNEAACNLITAQPGAINHLASIFTAAETAGAAARQQSIQQAAEQDGGGRGRLSGGGSGLKGSTAFGEGSLHGASGSAGGAAESGGHTSLADMGDGILLPGMSAARDAIIEAVEPARAEMYRPMIIPVASKAEAVTCLRNIATSNDQNRTVITEQQGASCHSNVGRPRLHPAGCWLINPPADVALKAPLCCRSSAYLPPNLPLLP